MEFELIQRFFARRWSLEVATAPGWSIGIGDDCAVGSISGQLLLSKDLLCAGIHFFEDCDPADLGWKSLAVNLSDLAAMGAKPEGFLLGLGLSELSEPWLEAFADGLFDIAQQFSCPLVGGDTTRTKCGPVVSITIVGSAPLEQSVLKRSGGALGDQIWVSGLPGLARLGLLQEAARRGRLGDFLPETQQQRHFCDLWESLSLPMRESALNRIARPMPRIELGKALVGRASGAIDLSDGLSGDLRHLCKSSGLGAKIEHSSLTNLWRARLPNLDTQLLDFLVSQSLQGGDDYELCFTAAEIRQDEIRALSRSLDLELSCIGCMTAGEVLGLSQNGYLKPLNDHSFKHFHGSAERSQV